MTNLMTENDACSWALGVWEPFGLAWQPAVVAPGQARLRVSGKSPDRNALIDVTIGPRQRRVLEVAIAVPVHPEKEQAARFARLVAFSLAVISGATLEAADTWLAEALRGLRRDQPSRIQHRWHQWRVTIATTTAGILAVHIARS